MKNVLVLTYFFPPAPLAYSQRIGKLCKYLGRNSEWTPCVLCGELPWDLLPGRDDALLADIPGNVTISRVGSFLSSGLASQLRRWRLYKPIGLIRKFLVRPDAYGDWIARAINAAQTEYVNGAGLDAIFACGPPNSVWVLGMELSQKWHLPLVLDLRDPWLPLYDQQHWFERWYMRQSLPLERKVYQQATGIIINTAGAAAELKRRFPEFADKIVTIPNGFDPEDLNWHRGPALRQPDEAEGTVHILNLGGIRGSGVEEALFKIIADYLQENPAERRRLRVHFVGGVWDQIAKPVTTLGISDVCLAHGMVPGNEVGRPLAEADIYTLLQPEHHAFSIPSKLFYYLAGGGYIFTIIPEVLKADITQQIPNYPKIFEFGSVTGTAALARIIERARQGRRTNVDNTFPPYALSYDRRTIAQQVGDFLDQAIKSRY